MSTPRNWDEFYQLTADSPPSSLILKALAFVKEKGKAIDIGAGALKDTRFLLNEGFEVTAIDAEPALTHFSEHLNNEKLQSIVTTYEDFVFPENTFDLASAIYALPFNPPDSYERVFSNIKHSLKKEGILCCQFFGTRDTWSTNSRMTFHTEVQIRELLSNFEIVSLVEDEKDGTTTVGTLKHWHVFHVVARKL
jgi:tellurite methyltransferase